MNDPLNDPLRNPADDALHERIDDYLDGLLPGPEARALEAELLDPEVAAALSEALALRTLLAALPPDLPPEGLAARIEEAMGLPAAGVVGRIKQRAARFPRLDAVLGGAAWALRGPSLAANAAGADGLRTVGYLAAPLASRRADPPPKPALWRRLMRLGG